MAEYLFLVESNEKAEQITLIAGDQVEVVVVKSCPASFSMSPQEELGSSIFSFQPIAAVWESVLRRVTNYEDVYYCFETSIDGEYLSYLVDQLLRITAPNVVGHRLNVAGFSNDVLMQSISFIEPLAEKKCVRILHHDLFHKVFYSHLARLLGTTKGPGGVELSIIALTMFSLIADKHESLSRITQHKKWEVEIVAKHDGQDVVGRLAEIYGVSSDGFLDSASQVKEVAGEIKGSAFTFVDRSEAELRFPRPALYTLPELILDAHRFCQISADDVMSGLEMLSVGVHSGVEERCLITSPYGVSTQNMQPVFERLCQFVTRTYDQDAQVNAGFVNGVILPLDTALRPDDMQLPPQLQQLYMLIWTRSVASQMVDGLCHDLKVTFEADGRRVQFASFSLVRPGFLDVFSHGYESVLTQTSSHVFKKEEEVTIDKAVPQQAHTGDVAQYQISSLCEDMFEMGFDDEKLILTVFQKMQDHHYVMLSADGEILCTQTLLKVTATLDRAFPGMKGLNLSAYYGQTLEEVMSGRKRVDVALKQFDQNLIMQGKPLVKVKVPTALPTLKRKSKNVIKGGQATVKSTGAVIEGFANFNDEKDEDNFQDTPSVVEESPPEIKVEHDFTEVVDEHVADGIEITEDAERNVEDEESLTAIIDSEVPETVEIVPPLKDEEDASPAEDVFAQPTLIEEDVVEPKVEPPVASLELSEVETKPCPECSRPMVIKDDRFGKFWACTGMPACHHSEAYQKKKDAEVQQACPVCKRGVLSVNRTPAGKDMYVCNDSACEFMAWAKPHAIDCPLCGSAFLVQKKDRQGNVNLRCPMAGCSYVHGESVGAEGQNKPRKKKVRVRRKKSGISTGKKRRVVRRKRKVAK